MSIIDAIKKSVLEGFVTSLTGTEIVFGLAVAFLASLFILFIYQRTMKQVTLNRSFCVSLLLIGTISAMMVLTITSNLALSLGMVGALSIVRFRTAVKDASDTAFLFWAVAAGITSGAGFYLLTLLGCLFVGLVCVVSMILFDRVAKPFLLVVRANEAEAAAQVDKLLEKSGMKYSLSSQVQNQSYTEVIYELAVPAKGTKLVAKVTEIPGITNVSLVDCRKG
jgi:uncharacterized membrane protein YhiD involved in acid resistance